MKRVTPTKHNYIQWISPEEMHQEAISWISELKFAKDEQKFLNNLVKSHTLQLTESSIFEKSREIVGAIADAETELVSLMKAVQSHENLLEIMIDDIDQPKMEKAYKETHLDLTMRVDEYVRDYRKLKMRLFSMLTEVLKKEKQKRLLN